MLSRQQRESGCGLQHPGLSGAGPGLLSAWGTDWNAQDLWRSCQGSRPGHVPQVRANRQGDPCPHCRASTCWGAQISQVCFTSRLVHAFLSFSMLLWILEYFSYNDIPVYENKVVLFQVSLCFTYLIMWNIHLQFLRKLLLFMWCYEYWYECSLLLRPVSFITSLFTRWQCAFWYEFDGYLLVCC